MSGHSKWATIKHKKGAADAKRGKMFSRLAKEIMIVAKSGGDPDKNAGLRTLVQKAKGINMPNENIDRAIKKGTGELQAESYEEITYEGYAAGSVGLVVKVLTDNKNRAAAEIRNIFKKNNSDFASQGSVFRNFERKGQILIAKKDGVDEDTLMGIVLDAGADDMTGDDDGFEVLCQPQAFADVCAALEKAGIVPEDSEVKLIPLVQAPVSDLSVAQAVTKFVNALEDNDDVQNVYHNMDVSDEIAEQLE